MSRRPVGIWRDFDLRMLAAAMRRDTQGAGKQQESAEWYLENAIHIDVRDRLQLRVSVELKPTVDSRGSVKLRCFVCPTHVIGVPVYLPSLRHHQPLAYDEHPGLANIVAIHSFPSVSCISCRLIMYG